MPPVYDLFAISQHYGSLGGGHYTATCAYEGQGWYAFNDTGVARAEAMDPADSARSAYVLFYRRQQDLRSSPSELMLPRLPVNHSLQTGFRQFWHVQSGTLGVSGVRFSPSELAPTKRPHESGMSGT